MEPSLVRRYEAGYRDRTRALQAEIDALVREVRKEREPTTVEAIDSVMLELETLVDWVMRA